MIENESRGRDSAGVAVFNVKETKVMKQPMRATKLAETLTFQEFLDKNIHDDTYNVLIHTRAGTKGSETISDNNHPIVSKDFVGVHNGMIWNDDDLFDSEKLIRQAQVDSEVIFRLLDKYKDSKTVAEKLSGSFTFAYAAKEGNPAVVTLVKHNNPVTLAYIESLNVIVFASEAKFLTDAILSANMDFGYDKFVDAASIVLTPKADTILTFNSSVDSAVAQLAQEPVGFKSSYGYGSTSYDWTNDWYLDDEMEWNYRWSSREQRYKQITQGISLPAGKNDKVEKLTIKGIYEKLTAEERSLFDSYVEEQAEFQWNVGFSAGRASLDEAIEQDKDFAYEEGFNKGFDKGFEQGYEEGYIDRASGKTAKVALGVLPLPAPKVQN
jgi:hypothetical protein